MSKSNKCPTDSSSSNERDFKPNHYQYRKHHHHHTSPKKAENPLSDICKYLDVSSDRKSSKDNVELALEVEINESLKHVLTNAERNSSDLLDVTIIRPSDSDTTHETTVALYKDEVRDFISLVEQHHRHNLKEPNERPKENRPGNDDDSNEDNNRKDAPKQTRQRENRNKSKGKRGYEYIQEPERHKSQERVGKLDENPKHVYATINTFDKIRQALPCQNKDRESDKPGTPCMCQHCGIIGVLVQSQKGPVAPFPPLEDNVAHQPQPNTNYKPREVSTTRGDPRSRRIGDIRKKKSLDQLQLLREINARIKSLEKRIAVQEETAVPREYLKHILHKVLLQYNYKINGNNMQETKLRNNATQYSTKNLNEPKNQFCQKNGNADKVKESKNKCYQVHTVLEDHPNWLEYSKESDLKATNEKGDKLKSNKDLYWFWGEEIVKPGCDLKNKILRLLDDKLYRKEERKQNDSSLRADNAIHYINRSEKVNSILNEQGIRVERDEKTIFLNNVDNMQSVRNFNYLSQGNQLPSTNSNKEDSSVCSKPTREPILPNNTNNFSTFRNIVPKTNYPFDIKKTQDDSTFRKNIEAQKERNKEKPAPPLEEKYYNNYAAHSIATESQASMEYILQKLRNNAKILESGLTREKEAQIEAKFRIPNAKDIPGSLIKENINRNGFRVKKEVSPTEGSVDIKFVNPRIKHWSEESSTSEDKIMRKKIRNIPEKKEPVALEKKESLIYKLDFLKNLARNKSTDQSRVLNKIWNQAKNTAKSKKDAVYIKIPFRQVNASEAQNNLIEMHLTLEELETVVKSAKVSSTGVNVKVQSYKSSSEIDFGQRKHEEMKNANKELLKRRQFSARANKHREKR